MNKRTLRVLEYHKIIEMLTTYAGSPEGKRACAKLKPFVELARIQENQRQTGDALNRIYRHGNVSFSGVYPVGEAMKRVAVGASLSTAELLDIAKLLQAAKNVRQYGTQMDEDEEKNADSLTGFFDSLMPLEHLLREINRCILSETEIADDASVGLKDIRRSMKGINNKIHDVLSGMVGKQTNQAMLQDSLITMRNGRYCIPVKAEYKSQFPGMVHDQSATGATIFIEPMAVVNLNNELKEYTAKEALEIEKILANLSEQVAQSKEAIETDAKVLAELDFIFAKAAFAKSYNGTEPEFNAEGKIEIKQGRHPLLGKHTVVPVDIRLGEEFTMLIITGPNTGGKTVSLKTLGLFTLMGQAGLHIPAFQGSKLAVFRDVLADIGDEQSIEQSLSTFSSHMSNIVYILRHADKDTLVLFDELGGGTDPEEGSALAVAILSELHNSDIRCMATTHYSELKAFAMTTEGIENACCEFDVETLSPTYHLLIGIPGKSNAFAIAGKLGLSKHVIENAKSQVGNETLDMENILAELEHSRKIITQEREEIEANKAEIQKLKERLASKNEHIEQRKQDILRNAREEAKEIIEDAKAFADASIRKYNNWEKKPHTVSNREMEQERDAIRAKLDSANEKLEHRVSNRKSHHKPEDFKLGDTVHVISLNTEGTVRSLPNQKNELTVQMGILQSTVKITDVEIIEEKRAAKEEKTVRYRASIGKAKTIKPEINLLGMTVDEAVMELDKYLDDACLSHLDHVRVVHGKGTGALRKGIHEYLKRQSYVKSFRLGEFGEGDAGVTIVEL